MGIAALFTQTVTVKTYTGVHAATGPGYAAATSVACFVNDSTKLTLNSRGEEVVSSTVLYCSLADYDKFPPQTQVVVNGTTGTVLRRYKRDSAGPASAWHTQVELA